MKCQAPAVQQAIELLELLNQSGPLNLTGIAAQTGFSKATLLRILATLEAYGWVSRSKSGDRKFEAEVMIRSKNHQNREQRIQEIVDNLCSKTNHTVEWYLLTDEYAEIVQRSEPANRVVLIKAKLGFRRSFSAELDAVVRVAAAAGAVDCRTAEPPNGYGFYRSGKIVHLSQHETQELIAKVGHDLLTFDHEWNSNGFRRHAVGVRRHDGKLAGILAVAAAFTPQADAETEGINAALSAAARQLEELLATPN